MVTEYQLSRRERMTEYLNSLKEEAKSINGDEYIIWLASGFLTLLISKLSQRNLVLEIPDCSSKTGNSYDLRILFTWNKNEHYLECEITYEERVEFFYKNNLTKEEWIEEFNITDWELYSRAVLDQLSLFVE